MPYETPSPKLKQTGTPAILCARADIYVHSSQHPRRVAVPATRADPLSLRFCFPAGCLIVYTTALAAATDAAILRAAKSSCILQS
ncbi:hypothetical protein VTJ04DRAFT_5968 [Mycothermus thermophilus]|uniref:uncharacterized protein n=1 Tax=Humicola insolens TaxID=85995 RepID=UPI0037430C58